MNNIEQLRREEEKRKAYEDMKPYIEAELNDGVQLDAEARERWIKIYEAEVNHELDERFADLRALIEEARGTKDRAKMDAMYLAIHKRVIELGLSCTEGEYQITEDVRYFVIMPTHGTDEDGDSHE